MRLGFVGVGKWSQKLATAFRACGAEIVAYDRQNAQKVREWGVDSWVERVPLLHGFGSYMPWRDQLADKSIDAIVAVAPPEITTEVALACAAAEKSVMATKPLFDHPERITAPFYVDFWRLWSGAQEERRRPEIVFHGCGPERGFPGLLDYGPHVLAAILDADFTCEVDEAFRRHEGPLELYDVRFKTYSGEFVHATFGNGSSIPERNWWGNPESALMIGREAKISVLQHFCRSFLSDISEGFVDTRLLELSRRGMAELRKIREMAK